MTVTSALHEPDVAGTARGPLARRPVLLTAAVLIAAFLAFRGWLLTHAWFQYDDFLWIQDAIDTDLTPGYLMEAHVGHLMPAGFLLTWVNAQLGPLDFFYPAVELWLFQAVAAVGGYRLLRHMFGERWGIIPPLVVMLFTSITLPGGTWWAAGINQLPVIITIVYGLHSHITYLRTRRLRHAFSTLGWILFGLAFSEKALVAYEVFGLVALAYFARGHLLERFAWLWRNYRAGMIVELAPIVVYLPYYLATSINFDSTTVTEQPLGDLGFNVVAVAFASAVVGGPLQWANVNVFTALADPTDLVLLVTWVAIGAVVYAAHQSRTRSKRAWSIVGALLFTNVLLVATGRANVVGPGLGLEYRYQTEVAVAAAISLALAFLPLLGAEETVEVKRVHAFADSRTYVAAACAAVIGLSTYSAVGFMGRDLVGKSPERYYANLEKSMAAMPKGKVPLVDLGVPDRIWGPFAFPSNLFSHMFSMYDRFAYPEITNDELYTVDSRGRIKPAVLEVWLRNEPAEDDFCPIDGTNGDDASPVYVIADSGETVIPLDGPVVGFGWWIRIGYVSSGPSEVRVTIDGEHYDHEVKRGLHSLFVKADGNYDSIEVSGLQRGVQLCTNDVTLGTPKPFIAP